MTLPVLICDDSNLARKQLARALPGDWDVDINFATHGQEAIEAIRAGRGDILFLDLNMPVMDGYAVLQTIRDEDLPTLVIVVSGDIQQAAHDKVKALGALDFIKKPVNSEKINQILIQYGVVENPSPQSASELARYSEIQVELSELMQEVTNVAMGEAGARLGKVLNTFVKLPVPKVMMVPYAQLKSRIAASHYDSLSAIAEGFIGNGITGEAILLTDEASFSRLFGLFGYEQDLRQVSDLEVLMDLSSVITGACLQGMSQQLDLQLSFSHPVALGRQLPAAQLLDNQGDEQPVLAVEVNYSLPEHQVECDLLILFTASSLPALQDRAGLI